MIIHLLAPAQSGPFPEVSLLRSATEYAAFFLQKGTWSLAELSLGRRAFARRVDGRLGLLGVGVA